MTNELAMENLIKIQNILGELGFTLTSEYSYYKDYASSNGTVYRIMPVFDKGLESQKAFDIVGFQIMSTKYINIVDGMLESSNIPKDCAEDISLITAVGSIKKNVEEKYIIENRCDRCRKKTPDFCVVNEATLCLQCLKDNV